MRIIGTGELLRRLYWLLNRRRLERELAEEMEAHRERMRERGGQFGNDLRLMEDAREAWGWTWIERFFQDLGYGVRQMARSPGFTVVAVTVLALGIGVNVAAFSLFNLALRPLPVRDPDSLVSLTRAGRGQLSSTVPYAALAFCRDHNTVLRSMFGIYQRALTIDNAATEVARADFVTGNYFRELAGPPAYGRMIDEQDDRRDSEPVVVLGYTFWGRRFGGDRSIIGRTIRLNNRPVTVVGVAASGFTGVRTREVDAWLPILKLPELEAGSTRLSDPNSGSVEMYGRLRPGLSIVAAQQALKPLMAQFWKTQSERGWEEEYLRVTPGAYSTLSRGDVALVTLLGTLVLLILVVACLNVGNMLLARAITREREISIRVSLGVGRARLLRQLLTESLLLALLAAAAGLGLAWAGTKAVLTYWQVRETAIWAVDYRVILFTLAATLLSTLMFGLTPALRASRQNYRSGRLRPILVGTQVAASCVLLIAAGFLLRGMQRALLIDPGFDYRQLLVVEPGLKDHGYRPGAARPYLEQLQSQLRAAPGVLSVSLATGAPFGGTWRFQPDRRGKLWIDQIAPGFLATAGVSLVAGRDFQPGERDAVIVSQSLARVEWPGENPLGKPYGDGKRIVIGVAATARLASLNDIDAMTVYEPLAGDSYDGALVLVKTAGSPERSAGIARSLAQALDPRLAPSIYLCRQRYEDAVGSSARGALVVSSLGALVLLLAVSGIYGLMSFTVSQRTREIGVRIALGAEGTHILALMLGQFWRPVAIGVTAGVAGGFAATQVLRHEFFGLSGLDPAIYTSAIGVFLVATAIAVLVPARRALRVNPITALRHD